MKGGLGYIPLFIFSALMVLALFRVAPLQSSFPSSHQHYKCNQSCRFSFIRLILLLVVGIVNHLRCL